MRPLSPAGARQLIDRWVQTHGQDPLDILRAATILRVVNASRPKKQQIFPNYDAVAWFLEKMGRPMSPKEVKKIAKQMKPSGLLVPGSLFLRAVQPRDDVVRAIQEDDKDLIIETLKAAQED